MIRIEADDHEIRQLLAELKAKLGNATEAMDEIGELVKLSVKRNFEAEGRPQRWPKSARAQAEGGQTLSDTGRLRNSFSHRAGPFAVEIGTNVQYAAIHHFGGVIRAKRAKALAVPGIGLRRSVRMPARPFLLLQEQDKALMLKILGRYLAAD